MLTYDVQDRVGNIRIARAAAGNAFTGEMVRRLAEVLCEAAGEADIVTLMGEGADFTVGRDRQEPRSGSPFEAFGYISALNAAISAFPGILITGVTGRAFGLGVGLVMRSDIAIAAADAKFALDEVKLGIPPMFIMEEIIEHVPSKRALEIILSSREFDAGEALQLGLLSQVLPPDRLGAAVNEFVTTLRACDRDVILACKRYFHAVRKIPTDARGSFALVEQTQFAMRKQRCVNRP